MDHQPTTGQDQAGGAIRAEKGEVPTRTAVTVDNSCLAGAGAGSMPRRSGHRCGHTHGYSRRAVIAAESVGRRTVRSTNSTFDAGPAVKSRTSIAVEPNGTVALSATPRTSCRKSCGPAALNPAHGVPLYRLRWLICGFRDSAGGSRQDTSLTDGITSAERVDKADSVDEDITPSIFHS